jgi:hypothetical protein
MNELLTELIVDAQRTKVWLSIHRPIINKLWDNCKVDIIADIDREISEYRQQILQENKIK